MTPLIAHRARHWSLVAAVFAFAAFSFSPDCLAQTLDEDLRREPLAQLVTDAQRSGDAQRGAVVFFQPHMACSKCHAVGETKTGGLGPDLAALEKTISDEQLVESVLLPSKVIRKGFDAVVLTLEDGRQISGLLVEQSQDKVSIREVSRNGELSFLPRDAIESITPTGRSLMPDGQMNQLSSRQQFLDLIRYLMEIRNGGSKRAADLQPPATLITFTVPEYEQKLDHTGLISTWNEQSLKRGEAIYNRVCVNCHGTKDKPGSLPISLKFAEGKFKNGHDPFAMYQTLTRGFGLMAAQTWMVPRQKYDVIHYVRETYLKPHNPTQYAAVDRTYLSRLPKGDTLGPEPSKIDTWAAMDYGPNLTHTYEVPGPRHNFAYKGIAIRLDSGAGGVSRGRHWMIFDEDTLRVAAAWSSSGGNDNFINWHGIQFNGMHGTHPQIAGQVHFANSTGPGWADPRSGSFEDKQRVVGRDDRRYGPLPREWGRFHGLYQHGQQVVLKYSIGPTEVLESPSVIATEHGPVFVRQFNIGPRDTDLFLQVAQHPDPKAILGMLSEGRISVPERATAAVLSLPPAPPPAPNDVPVQFAGSTMLHLPNADAFDFTSKDFTIVARMKTKSGGTLFAQAKRKIEWTPDGQTLFVRDGRLCFDIGWVGVIQSKSNVNDDKWHDVAASWQASSRKLRLYVDGQLDAEGTLAAKAKLEDSSLYIGFTAYDFPKPASFFTGELAEVRFYQRHADKELTVIQELKEKDPTLIGRWEFKAARGDQVTDSSGNGHHAAVHRGANWTAPPLPGRIVAGRKSDSASLKWDVADGRLLLKVLKRKQPCKFTVWTTSSQTLTDINDVVVQDSDRDLGPLTQGGPARWPQVIETAVATGSDSGPFAVDVLTAPESNPWLAQTRFTGLDFFDDGRMAVCSWDGDVWIVTPKVEDAAASASPGTKLLWRRVASGMFQPLGLRVIDGRIYLTCRDQLTVLHDLNGDGETDFYECLNNDHQVTEHFHEFAMGLQTDANGNFYYAKSARHALPAVVPHHGTLLKVSKDGSQTSILANGFRAANGVCLNPDGSFVVTDQEGHWNPKNRINWVTLDPSGKPKFYGNMYGYHDVTDSSNSAMQPPLCWITNAFDRSPAELLWVKSPKWGPLNGSLLNLSYGYGKVFVVPHERVSSASGSSGTNDVVMQGGMCELPLPTFPTGIMRGRFNPLDGQLYACGMFAWAGNATQPGGLYRIRATGKPMHLPTGLKATTSGLQITFTEPLDAASVKQADAFTVKTWSLKRTANYGSAHHDERPREIRSATLSQDGRTVTLDVAGLEPTWGMEIKFALRAANQTPVRGVIHNTIHQLNP